jgi:hypothetical protein
VDEPPLSSEAPRTSALDPGNGLATTRAGPDSHTSIGSTVAAGMRGLTASGEQLALQDGFLAAFSCDPEQVPRGCAEDLFACATRCRHAASILPTLCLSRHPQVDPEYALLQTGTISEGMSGTDSGMEQQMNHFLEVETSTSRGAGLRQLEGTGRTMI